MTAATSHERGPDSFARARLPALDGVRGLAILLVLVNNLYPERPSTPLDAAVEAATNLWWVGVDVFFALSGFLITGVLLDSRSSGHYFRNFYARRALRIAPLYYGVLLVIVAASALVFTGADEGGSQFLRRQWWYWSYLVNVMIARHGPASADYGTGHLWSLSAEEQFYLVWPAVVLWLPPRRLARFCLTLLVGALILRVWWLASGRSPVVVYVLATTHADGLVIGALLALAARSPTWWVRAARWARPMFVACAPVALALVAWSRVGGRRGVVAAYTVGFTCIAVASGALLVLALEAPPGTRTAGVFHHPVMRFFGQYSYGIYVFSGLVEVTLWKVAPLFMTLPRLAGSQIPVATAVLVVAATLSTALAYLSYHLFEKHWLRLKRHFPTSHRGGRRSPASAAGRGDGDVRPGGR